jgi:hypothetical protein
VGAFLGRLGEEGGEKAFAFVCLCCIYVACIMSGSDTQRVTDASL